MVSLGNMGMLERGGLPWLPGVLTMNNGIVVFNNARRDVDISFDTANNPATIYIDSSRGDVGFGLATPQAKIHVRSGSAGGNYEATSRTIIEADDGAILSLLVATGDVSGANIYFGGGDGSSGAVGDTDRAGIGYARDADHLGLHIGSSGSPGAGLAIRMWGGATQGRVHIHPVNTAPDVDLEVSDGTTIGAGTIHALVIGAHTGSISVGALKYTGTNTTGAGAALLGANSPAVTNSAPYTWFQVTTSDGSTGFIPVWK